MYGSRPWAVILVLAVLLDGVVAYKFSECEADIRMVQNGTSTKFTNETIQQSRYFGPVKGLNTFVNRTEYLTLTYQGTGQLPSAPCATFGNL
jgi:hypothetical protein